MHGQVDFARRQHPAPESFAPISAELAFLLDHGVAPSLLRRAVAMADEAGVEPAQALLANGFVDEDTFFRALAGATDMPFLAHVSAADEAAFPASIHAGLAPLAERHAPLRYAHAPQGIHLARFLSSSPRHHHLAITTPSALRDAVIAVNAASVASASANALSLHDPDLSYRDATTLAQRLTLSGTGLALALFFVLDALTAAALIASSLGILFLALANIRVAACLGRALIRDERIRMRREDMDLPVYTLVIPLYREANVVADLCAALMRLDYPLALLDIKLMVEADDAATQAALRALALPAAFEIIVAPDGKPRTKPRALNIALPLARGEFLVVYDAEDAPERDQLRLAVEVFAEQPTYVCCLQARLSIDNQRDGFFAKCFAIEYAALFDVINPGLARLGLPIPLGGTSNHFRVAALRRIHGWDAWNVTEDADLGVRLARLGFQVADLPSTTFEEAPTRYRSWRDQRTRWMKGFLQTAITHSRNPRSSLRDLGATAFISAIALTLGTVLAAMLYPVFVAIALLVIAAAGIQSIGYDVGLLIPDTALAFKENWFGIMAAAIGFVTFAAGALSMIVPAILGVWRRRWFSLFPWLLLMPVYYLLISIAAWRGLYELIVAPSRWNKTQHGISRQRCRM
jgi:cellulose synthase/poly-beta-1,6-N-acetylglucosamine synthase-like glycosyltransferase